MEVALVERIVARSGRDLAVHAILSACCSQIPLPLVDDMARRVVRGFMFSTQGRTYQQALTARDVLALSEDPDDGKDVGCLRGCLSMVFYKIVLFPVRKVVQTVNFVRNYQDLMDLAAMTFVEGYLAAYMMEEKRWPGAPKAREAIDQVIREKGIAPVQSVFRHILTEFRNEIQNVARSIFRKLRLKPRTRPAVTQTLDLERLQEEERALEPIVLRLLAGLRDPMDYLESLHGQLDAALGGPAPPAPDAPPPDDP